MKKVNDLENSKVGSCFSVEFENGILSVSEDRLEFASIEKAQGTLVIKFGSENLYPLFEKFFKKQYPGFVQPLAFPAWDTVVPFIKDSYIISDTEFKSVNCLWEEYRLYCERNYLILASKDDFRERLCFLGFKIRKHPKNSKMVVYCKGNSNATLIVNGIS